MGFRFFKRIKIAPGLTVNLSKSGASVSTGVKGAKVTVGPRGTRTTVGIPGTGVYYTKENRRSKPSTNGQQHAKYKSVLNALAKQEKVLTNLRPRVLKAAKKNDMKTVESLLTAAVQSARRSHAMLVGSTPPRGFQKGHSYFLQSYNMYIEGLDTMVLAVKTEDEKLFHQGMTTFMKGNIVGNKAADAIERAV